MGNNKIKFGIIIILYFGISGYSFAQKQYNCFESKNLSTICFLDSLKVKLELHYSIYTGRIIAEGSYNIIKNKVFIKLNEYNNKKKSGYEIIRQANSRTTNLIIKCFLEKDQIGDSSCNCVFWDIYNDNGLVRRNIIDESSTVIYSDSLNNINGKYITIESGGLQSLKIPIEIGKTTEYKVFLTKSVRYLEEGVLIFKKNKKFTRLRFCNGQKYVGYKKYVFLSAPNGVHL